MKNETKLTLIVFSGFDFYLLLNLSVEKSCKGETLNTNLLYINHYIIHNKPIFYHFIMFKNDERIIQSANLLTFWTAHSVEGKKLKSRVTSWNLKSHDWSFASVTDVHWRPWDPAPGTHTPFQPVKVVVGVLSVQSIMWWSRNISWI